MRADRLCFFCKQKTAYEMRISDRSSDVCSSDLPTCGQRACGWCGGQSASRRHLPRTARNPQAPVRTFPHSIRPKTRRRSNSMKRTSWSWKMLMTMKNRQSCRSEEHTSELQSLMRNSYAVFCLKKKKQHKEKQNAEKKHKMWNKNTDQ